MIRVNVEAALTCTHSWKRTVVQEEGHDGRAQGVRDGDHLDQGLDQLHPALLLVRDVVEPHEAGRRVLLVLHEGADHKERLQHEGVDGVAVGGAGTHHRVRVGRGAHQAGARITGLHNITLLTHRGCVSLSILSSVPGTACQWQLGSGRRRLGRVWSRARPCRDTRTCSPSPVITTQRLTPSHQYL